MTAFPAEGCLRPQPHQRHLGLLSPASSSPSTVSTADYAIPMQNRFDVLNSTPGTMTSEASPASPPKYTIPVHVSGRENVPHDPPASSAQQMTQTTIVQATDSPLIRDSAVKQMRPNKKKHWGILPCSDVPKKCALYVFTVIPPLTVFGTLWRN